MMLKSKPIKQLFFILCTFVILFSSYYVSQMILQKNLKRNIDQSIASLLQHNSAIEHIHYKDIAAPWDALWHKKISLKDVRIAIKNAPTEIQIAKLSVQKRNGFNISFSNLSISMPLLHQYMDQENKTKPMPIFLTHPSTVKISIANTAQMMIQLPSGSHHIPLEYLPPGYHTLSITIIDNDTKKHITTSQSVYIAPQYLSEFNAWLADKHSDTLHLTGSLNYQRDSKNLDIALHTKVQNTKLAFNSHYSQLTIPQDASIEQGLQAILGPKVQNTQLSFEIEKKISHDTNPLKALIPDTMAKKILKYHDLFSLSCAQDLQKNTALLFSCSASLEHLGTLHALLNVKNLDSNWLGPMLFNKGNTISWSNIQPRSLKIQYRDDGLIDAMLAVLSGAKTTDKTSMHQAQLRWQQAVDTTLAPLGPNHYQTSAKAILAKPKDYTLHVDLQAPQDKTIAQLQTALEQQIQNSDFGSNLAIDILRFFKVKIYGTEIIPETNKV